MKKLIIYITLLLIAVNSCIVIEDDPLVTVEPTVVFQGHIRNDSVYVTALISANPAFIIPGNIATLFRYEGKLELYNMDSGTLLKSSTVAGDGLSTVVEVSAKAMSFEDIVIIASGKVSAYADKGSDGDPSNDLFIHQADFHEEVPVAEVINLDEYPIVTMDPVVDFQIYMRGEELYATATVSANPSYENAGSIPIVFSHNGVLQIFDQISGALLKSRAVSGIGLSNIATVSADTTSLSSFLIISSGEIICTGDVGSDGDASNDILISTSKYYEVLEVGLED